MNFEKAVTYSLLAHIRNTGSLVKGPIDVFIPMVKRTLYLMNREGVSMGKNIMEIKRFFDKIYQIDIPIPVLQSVLKTIASEFNALNIKNFQLFNDQAFLIKDYVFDEFEESVQKSHQETKQLQSLFVKFCKLQGYDDENNTSIFDFIDKSKVRLGKYLNNLKISNDKKFTIEARFVSYFKDIPSAYDLIRKIYLGSILSSYLEYKTENTVSSVELLLDTNFIISLLDLNTPESAHTCMKLIEVGGNQGYRFSVLKDTIDEAHMLLRKRAENMNHVFMQSFINPEDIYNACERRGLKPSDLERIADRLEEDLTKLNVKVVALTSKYVDKAKASSEFQALQKVRYSYKAALHDATAITYVKDRRGDRKVYDFEKVNCWFVHNSNTPENENKYSSSARREQSYSIKADELLNILWLSSPSIAASITESDITDIGLSALVAFTLREDLPKSSIIRELDENIQKYAKEEISDHDILMISTRIVNRQLVDVEQLNILANGEDKSEFVSRLKIEADKEKENQAKRQSQIEAMLSELRETVTDFQKSRSNIVHRGRIQTKEKEEYEQKAMALERQLADERRRATSLENQIRKTKRDKFFEKKIYRWRALSVAELVLCCIGILLPPLYVLYTSEWNMDTAKEKIVSLQQDVIVSGFVSLVSCILLSWVMPSLVLKFRNESNIEKFKANLELPEDSKEIV